MPLFSIIIPCYNRGHFLVATVESVLKQNLSDFEILIIDDGSTDNTAQIVSELEQQDKRIHYYYKTNGERAAARNFGLSHAKGSLIVFLDSDDEFLPGHLEHLKELSEKHPKINFFATKFDFIEDGQVFKAPIDSLSEGIYDYKILKRGNPFACNVCVRKNNPALRLFKEDRIYSGMEDWIFLFSNTWSQDLFLSGKTTVRMNEHPNRSMRFNKIIVEKRILATQFIIKNFGLFPAEKRKIYGFTSYFCAIHTYLDNDKKSGLKWILSAMKYLGIKKDLLSLSLKLLFGRKIIGKLKDAIYHK